MKTDRDIYDYATIKNIISKALKSDNLETALKGAELAIQDQIRITLHKAYQHGWTDASN